MKIENIISERIVAIIPDYDDRGNYTKVYTKQGNIYEIDKSLKSVRTQLCRYYLIDLKAAKKYFSDILIMKNLAPISFDGEDVFVYIKTRIPLFKNDGAHGLINTSYVKEVTKDNNEVIIELCTNEKIISLWTLKNTKRHINRGNYLKKQYKRNPMLITNDYDYYDEHNKPITINDIIIVMEETLRIIKNQ